MLFDFLGGIIQQPFSTCNSVLIFVSCRQLSNDFSVCAGLWSNLCFSKSAYARRTSHFSLPPFPPWWVISAQQQHFPHQLEGRQGNGSAADLGGQQAASTKGKHELNGFVDHLSHICHLVFSWLVNTWKVKLMEAAMKGRLWSSSTVKLETQMWSSQLLKLEKLPV